MAQKKISDLTSKTTFSTDDLFEIETSAGVSRKLLGSAINSAIIDIIYPVGCFYTQYPDAASSTEATAFPTAYSPATLFGGTWVSQFDTENVFFRTKGTDYQTRTNGLSADEMQGHRHTITATNIVSGSGIPAGTGFSGSAPSIGDPITDGTNGTPRTGAVTEPRNRLFKIWKRTA